ncbi:hypothetical protein GCM10022380_88310 [Amycolatopsis tucumanensis]|uniref:Uncharacterized protein n=1 Tax=Amycolatopsis tucumanensis TaxID=401106 RepID=A0ABP7JX80_9PSEU
MARQVRGLREHDRRIGLRAGILSDLRSGRCSCRMGRVLVLVATGVFVPFGDVTSLGHEAMVVGDEAGPGLRMCARDDQQPQQNQENRWPTPSSRAGTHSRDANRSWRAPATVHSARRPIV